MRSLLFVPADNKRKLEKALESGADALILDLEDSVADANKHEARRNALAFLREHQDRAERPLLYVRINALTAELSEGDLDCIMVAAPDGIVLPKAGRGGSVALLDSRLGVREALHGHPDGRTRIMPIATETAAAMFTLGSYAGSSPRLAGLSWGAEDLSAEIGAGTVRVDGSWTEPFRLARSLCLFGAAAAGVSAVDTVYTDFRDSAGLERECREAQQDGFAAKLAIHPGQVLIINEIFTPSADALARAKQVVAAFGEAGGAGVTSIGGAMLDRPHLKAAERLLARVGRPSGGRAAE